MKNLVGFPLSETKKMPDGKVRVGIAPFAKFPKDLIYGFGSNQAEAYQNAMNEVNKFFK